MITKNDRRLGNAIKKTRKQRQMTQEQLADKVRITPKYVQFVEVARRKPSLKTLYRLAQALKVRPKELLP